MQQLSEALGRTAEIEIWFACVAVAALVAVLLVVIFALIAECDDSGRLPLQR